jgi:hypothetical protein
VPRLTALVDWDGTGWTDPGYCGLLALPSTQLSPAAIDVVHPTSAAWQRGVNASFSGDMTGSATITLDNSDSAYTPDRNWCDNPSFENGLTGWSSRALAGYNAAARVSVTLADAAPGAGSACAEVVMPGAAGDEGVNYRMPWRFRSGQPYTLRISAKKASGPSGNVRFFIGSAGTPSDSANTGPVATSGAWQSWTVTWTPSADRTDAVVTMQSWGTNAGDTIRIDAVQVNPGATANAYLEAPTRGCLVPGRPVLLYADWGPSRAPQFYGYVQRITPNPLDLTVTLLCHDQSQRLANAYAVPQLSTTYRRYRGLLLDALAQQGVNLAANGSFESDLNGTSNAWGAPSRVTTDAVDGGYSLQVGTGVRLYGNGLAMTATGQVYTASFWARALSGTSSYTATLYTGPNAGDIAQVPITVTTAWQRFSVSNAATAVTAQSRVGGTYQAMLVDVVRSAGGDILLDCFAITAGPYLYPWQDPGVGRHPNLVADANSEFEYAAPAATSWVAPFPNLVPDGGFESGNPPSTWTPTNCTLSNAGSPAGGWGNRSMAVVNNGAGSSSVTVTLTGVTLAANTTYGMSVRAYNATGSANSITAKLSTGANGTAVNVAIGAWGTAYATIAVGASPIVNPVASIIQLAGTGGGLTWYVDTVTVTVGGPRDALLGIPGGFTAGGCTAGWGSSGYSGARSMALSTPAVAGAATAYEMTATGAYFYPGRPYTVSFWHRLVSGTTDWRAAIGVGGVDEASVAFTPGLQWQRCAFTWWPRLEWDCGTGGAGTSMSPVALAIGTPSGTGAAQVLIDSIRIEASGALADQESPWWQLDAGESDLALAVTGTGAGSYGTVAAALSALNAASLGRQAVLPSMDWPFWRYRSRHRSTDGAWPVDEAVVEDFEAVNGMERDEASAVNSQAVWSAASTYGPVWASDDYSTGLLGPSPGAAIQNAALVATQAEALDIAQTVVSRYRLGVARPVLTVKNRFPSQTARDVGDVIAVTMARGMLQSARFTVLSLQTTVSDAGQLWTTQYTLEERV